MGWGSGWLKQAGPVWSLGGRRTTEEEAFSVGKIRCWKWVWEGINTGELLEANENIWG